MEKFSQFLLSAHNTSIFSFQDNNLNKSQWIFTQSDMCIDGDLVWGCSGYISSIFDRFFSPGHGNCGIIVLHFYLFIQGELPGYLLVLSSIAGSIVFYIIIFF